MGDANGDWNQWGKFVLAELRNAKEDRKDIKKGLEKFIETTFADFLKEEHKTLEKRVVKVERVIWALGLGWVVVVAIVIWGVQQLLAGLV